MHALPTSFASASSQLSPAYQAHGGASRSHQALEAVDAYLRRDSTCSAPRVASLRVVRLLSEVVEKLLH
jgi:hypothetical protein